MSKQTKNWRPLRILFIGDEPSSRNLDPNVPFVGTASYKRLLRWIGELDLILDHTNVVNSGTFYSSYYDVYLFLGKNAAKKSKLIELEKTKARAKTVDHPSPRNRKFNEPGYEARMLRELKAWLYSEEAKS